MSSSRLYPEMLQKRSFTYFRKLSGVVTETIAC